MDIILHYYVIFLCKPCVALGAGSNVRTEFILLCLGYNVNKLHSKIPNERC